MDTQRCGELRKPDTIVVVIDENYSTPWTWTEENAEAKETAELDTGQDGDGDCKQNGSEASCQCSAPQLHTDREETTTRGCERNPASPHFNALPLLFTKVVSKGNSKRLEPNWLRILYFFLHMRVECN